jgi:hypothetical protein
MLATVSRRDPARAAADVWTSGNRIFRCAGPDLFRVVVAATGRGEIAVDAVEGAVRRPLTPDESRLTLRAADQAVELIRLEQSDVNREDAAIGREGRGVGCRPGGLPNCRTE